MFEFPGWMWKNFIPCNFSWRVSAETWDASCFNYWKNNTVFQTLATYCHWKTFFNFCIFQISLQYIKLKLVIPKILFILVLCNFNFYFKIMWPPPGAPHPPPPPQTNKIILGIQFAFWILLIKNSFTMKV